MKQEILRTNEFNGYLTWEHFFCVITMHAISHIQASL